MEVRKEFMPGIVQNYNKSKQVTTTGEPSKVSIFKLNPMHLSVQKGYLKDKFNVNASKEQRDLGGLMLLIVFNLLRRKFWQTAPLLEQKAPAHPVFTLDFLRPARMNGSWDRWVAVTPNYHKEVAGMLRALNGPLFSMAGLQPPHLIVARLLEPVHLLDSHLNIGFSSNQSYKLLAHEKPCVCLRVSSSSSLFMGSAVVSDGKLLFAGHLQQYTIAAEARL
ncbi:TPA: hypothetical protein ACH3X1_014279 [Trebouxia sp. C0004]